MASFRTNWRTCSGLRELDDWPCLDIDGEKVRFLSNSRRSGSYRGLNQTYSAYCMSLPVAEQCMLQFSLTILLVVIGCNVVKLMCLLGTIWALNHPTLVTLGDAIASFLEKPDSITRGFCMMTRKNAQEGIFPISVQWDYRPHFWFAATGSGRIIIFNTLWVPPAVHSHVG